MKKTLKIAALVAAAVMAMGFVSCANDDAEDLGTLLIVKDYQEKKEAEAKAAAAAAAATTTTNTNTNSGNSSSESDNSTTEQTYTLDVATLDAVSAGSKSDGDKTTVGTSNFYTIVWSAKMLIDTSEKKFSDGYAAKKRINLKGAWTNSKQHIQFTTTKAATVKVWWTAGGDNYSLDIAKKSDRTKIIASDGASATKNSNYISTLSLTDADTYMLGSSVNGNSIYKIEITE